MTTRRPELSVQDIKRLANDRRHEILRALGVTGRPNGKGMMLIAAPHRKNNNTPAFAIWTHGGYIAWKDYGSGEKGDILQLVDLVRGWTHLAKGGVSSEGIRFLKGVLGLETIDIAQARRDAAAARARAEDDEKRAASEARKNQARARAHWIRSPDAFTLEPARRYITETRGLDFDKLPHGPRGGDRTPTILHAIACEKHIGEDAAETYWPAIVTPCVDFHSADGKGVIRAIHRAWIMPDGSDKAPVKPPRKCWPAAAGLVLPLWRGDSGLSVAEAIANGLRETLVLTEGWEDGYSSVLAAPEFRTWAVISLSNLGNVPIPECVDSIIVHRQNDWLKPQAVEAFERAKAKLEASGRPVSELRAFHGKDINDTLRG